VREIERRRRRKTVSLLRQILGVGSGRRRKVWRDEKQRTMIRGEKKDHVKKTRDPQMLSYFRTVRQAPRRQSSRRIEKGGISGV